MDYQYSSTGGAAFGAGMCFIWVIILASAALGLVVCAFIFKKAGYHWAFTFLMIVPIANLVWILIFAFGTWPIHRELEQLRRQAGGAAQPPGGMPPPRQ